MRGTQGNPSNRMLHFKEYRVWAKMKQRCINKNEKSYSRYGAKGVTVCERWTTSFDAFISDMGPRPTDKHSIDRINSRLGYSPDNCRWATIGEQQRNRCMTRNITHNGKTMCAADWASELGINHGTLLKRINSGWPTNAALSKENFNNKRHRDAFIDPKVLFGGPAKQVAEETGIPIATIYFKRHKAKYRKNEYQ